MGSCLRSCPSHPRMSHSKCDGRPHFSANGADKHRAGQLEAIVLFLFLWEIVVHDADRQLRMNLSEVFWTKSYDMSI